MKKKNILNFVKYTSFIAMIIFFNSCGLMFGGSKYMGKIEVKNKPNAEIVWNGNTIGKGSAEFLFPRQENLRLEIKQEGCPTKNVVFPNKFRTGNFILSVVSWSLLGGVLDLATGAAYKPDNDIPGVIQNNTKSFAFNINYTECDKK